MARFHTDPNRDLKEGTRGGTSSLRQNRFRSALVATEIALSVVLLSGAGMLVHSFWNTLRVNPGFDPNGLLVARIWIPFPNNPAMNRYRTAPAIADLTREILRRVRALPGIEEAAMGADNSVPLVTNTRNQTAFWLPDQSDSALKHAPPNPPLSARNSSRSCERLCCAGASLPNRIQIKPSKWSSSTNPSRNNT